MPYLICANTFVLLSDIVLAENTMPGQARNLRVTVGLSRSPSSTTRGRIKCGCMPLRNMNMHVHVKNNSFRGVPIVSYISRHNIHTTCVIIPSFATTRANTALRDNVEQIIVITSRIRCTCRFRLNLEFRELIGSNSDKHLQRPTTRPVSVHTMSL